MLCNSGNEWGHPEWVDFPRPGNNYSYDKCRRRWDLLEDNLLRYQHIYNLDKAMLHLANEHPFMDTREVNDWLLLPLLLSTHRNTTAVHHRAKR